LPVARTLAPERRALLRELGDTLSDITATAVQHQPIDETTIEHLTAADITADPFAIAGRLMDIPAYLTEVLSRLGSADFVTGCRPGTGVATRRFGTSFRDGLIWAGRHRRRWSQK